MNSDWIDRSEAFTPRIRNFVSGRWQDTDEEGDLQKFSPRNGRLLYRFSSGTEHDVEAAIASARRSFEDGRWRTRPVQQRKDVLYRLAALLHEHRERFALLECLDVGKPITDALTVDLPMAQATIRFFAEAADKLYGHVYGTDSRSLSYQQHRPVGVVAAIIGWNFPLVLATQKIGPALAAGNSVVLKPSELTSLSASYLAELAIQAGLPEGVLNVVNGGPELGAHLARHPEVDLLTFTGSTHTGKKLLMAAGQHNMKRLILECGGKAPNIVFSTAPDLDAVAEAIVARAFWNQGQVCTASSRLLVQQNIKDELLGRVIRKTAELSPGDPLMPATRFGALVSASHLKKVKGYIESGTSEGARMVHRGCSSSPVEGGFYLSPVVFDQVIPSQSIAKEEIFGPVLSVISFRDEDEAVRIANGTIYGLSAILWSKDLGCAHRVTQRLQAGWITVNATECPAGGPGEGVMAIGGHKDSGMGVEGGIEGLSAYTSKTAVQIFV